MPEAEPRHAPRRSALPLLIAVLLIPAVLGSSQMIFNDGDVSWHIATGEWILDHRAIPHTDPFSFTWFGKPWVPIEWLAELLYASAYRLAGYGGVAALVTMALMALHAIVFVNAKRFVRPLLVVVAMDFVLIPMTLARPHVLAWPVVAGWTWLMMRAREADRAPALPLALVMTVWANLHGGFVFGLAIAGAFGLEAVLASEDKAGALRQWLLFGIACALATLINGNGIEGVLQPLRFTQLKMLPLIDEWKPSNPHVTPFFFAILAITLALIIWKRPRLHPARWLLLGFLLALALFQVRHQATLAIVAAMILPSGFSRTREASVRAGPDRTALAVTLVGAAVLTVVRAVMPFTLPDNEANPWRLIAAVPPKLRAETVFNGYSMGGPLILSGIRPYIDGRGDMYGDELVVGYANILHGDRDAFDEAVRRWNISWVILPNSDAGLPALLSHSVEWRLLAKDNVGVIYVRAPQKLSA